MLFALSIARTALSNRLARLQVPLRVLLVSSTSENQCTSIRHVGTAYLPHTAPVVQGHLFRAAFLRHVPLFIRNLSENVVLCLAAAAVESTAKTMLAHMELRWRRLLTSRMHTPYFENMVCLIQCHLPAQIVPAILEWLGVIANSCTLCLWQHGSAVCTLVSCIPDVKCGTACSWWQPCSCCYVSVSMKAVSAGVKASCSKTY